MILFINFGVIPSSGGSTPWILAADVWNDAGVWLDGETWGDA